MLALCGVCTQGMIVNSFFRHGSHPNLAGQNMNFDDSFLILNYWPTFISEIPAGVPDNISSFYAQACGSLSEHRWDAAGAMFRKALDVATKSLAPEASSRNLYQRIESLIQAGLLTPAMGDWAHEIRMEGNDAVHDDEPETEADARATHKFTEAFLTYTFSLPKMVTENRSKRAAENA